MTEPKYDLEMLFLVCDKTRLELTNLDLSNVKNATRVIGEWLALKFPGRFPEDNLKQIINAIYADLVIYRFPEKFLEKGREIAPEIVEILPGLTNGTVSFEDFKTKWEAFQKRMKRV